MRLPWFKRSGFFYLPVSFTGWLLTLAALAYAVYSFIDIDGRSHSVSDTLINFVFNALIIAAVYSLVAFITTRIHTAKMRAYENQYIKGLLIFILLRLSFI